MADKTVTLVCKEGHRVHWPADLWPRPKLCPAKAYGDHCGNDIVPGMKLVPDEEVGP